MTNRPGYQSQYYKTHPEQQKKRQAYAAERYRWYKAHGICVYCAKEDAEGGRVTCKACYERYSQRRQEDSWERRNGQFERWREEHGI